MFFSLSFALSTFHILTFFTLTTFTTLYKVRLTSTPHSLYRLINFSDQGPVILYPGPISVKCVAPSAIMAYDGTGSSGPDP